MMNKLQFRKLIREEIRKVLKESSLTETNSKLLNKLQDAYSNVYEYEDAGLEMLDSMADDAKLTKVLHKWMDKKPITDMEAKKLLKLFVDVADEMSFESEDDDF